ncbi:MAG: hypothetical protein LBU61_01920 [Coriobacteriales bacterium]|nr:hypothetical protein [Coriobacteriales bacterium]
MAYSISPRENYLLAMNHKPTEFIPMGMVHSTFMGFMDDYEKGPTGGGKDGFGVTWVYPDHMGINGPIPEPGNFVLEDVTKWKTEVVFPDLDAIDWEKKAEIDKAMWNPDMQTLEYASGNAPYERLVALMGFEGALIAMAIEPEATFELLSAITDYKIKKIKKLAKYYKPDIFSYHDDIATVRSLFMSPDTYRALLKPNHKRINDACREEGIIPQQHTCGKADICVADYIEAGAAAWSWVEPSNDIVGILTEYEGKFTMVGGFNMIGPPGMALGNEEVVMAENLRMLEQYSHLTGYIGTYIGAGQFTSARDPNASPEQQMQAMMAMMAPLMALVQDYEATRWKK